jgi:hypothetical protein
VISNHVLKVFPVTIIPQSIAEQQLTPKAELNRLVTKSASICDMRKLNNAFPSPLLLISLIIFLGLAVPDLQCQQADILNKKVRITAPSFTSIPIKGWPVNVTADTLVMRDTQGHLIRIPVEAVVRCEVATGRLSHAGTGMLIGAIAGAAAGITFCAKSRDDFESSSSLIFKISGAMGLGTLLGALIGTSFKSDRWIELSTSSLQISYMNTLDSAFGLCLTVRF